MKIFHKIATLIWHCVIFFLQFDHSFCVQNIYVNINYYIQLPYYLLSAKTKLYNLYLTNYCVDFIDFYKMLSY